MLRRKERMQIAFFLPMFLPTFLLGGIWLCSTVWLLDKYTYSMTPLEKSILWAGLWKGNIFSLWCLSALLSLAGFVCTWAMFFGLKGSGDYESKQGAWGSSLTVPLPLIISCQIAYNLLVPFHKVWFVCVVLWAAVLCTVWLWVCCWELFPGETWAHILNAFWILHSMGWDALYWFITWRRKLLDTKDMEMVTIDLCNPRSFTITSEEEDDEPKELSA